MIKNLTQKKIEILAASTAAFLIFILLGILILACLLFIAPKDAPYIARERESYDDGSAVIRVVQENSPTADEQIAKLAELGFAADRVSDEFFKEQLLSMWNEETLEMYPYWLIFTALGYEYNSLAPDDYEAEINYRKPPFSRAEIKPYSDCSFNFRRNYCYTPEHYVYILSQIERISGGEICLGNIECRRAFGIGRLEVSFTLESESYRYSIPGSRKRFNPEIITVIGELAGENDEGKKLYWNGDEQGVHIVYQDKETLTRLAEETGINFWGLDDAQKALW